MQLPVPCFCFLCAGGFICTSSLLSSSEDSASSPLLLPVVEFSKAASMALIEQADRSTFLSLLSFCLLPFHWLRFNFNSYFWAGVRASYSLLYYRSCTNISSCSSPSFQLLPPFLLTLKAAIVTSLTLKALVCLMKSLKRLTQESKSIRSAALAIMAVLAESSLSVLMPSTRCRTLVHGLTPAYPCCVRFSKILC